MHSMSPEDRFRLIKRDQDSLRDQAARDRMANAVSSRHTPDGSEGRTARVSDAHHAWMSAGRLLHAIGRYGLHRHGVVR